MRSRLLPLAIVLFWAGSVVWLCLVVWSPAGSGMTPVDPREVYRTFFEWNNSVGMTLLENGLRRGQINIGGGSGDDTESGETERVLSLSGVIEEFDKNTFAYVAQLSWRGSAVFDEAMARKEGSISLRIPRSDLNATLDFGGSADAGGAGFKATVTMGSQELFTYDSANAAGDPSTALGMLAPAGLPLADLLAPGKMDFKVETRFGNARLGGQEMRSFLLILRGAGPDQEIRIYLSEAGEPLRIESDLGFEAISEILVPLDAYKEKGSPGT